MTYKAPIKERIVVICYDLLAVETYRSICDSLAVFLAESLPEEAFQIEQINRPEITMPAPTIGDVEPDWSRVKVSVDRSLRFWNSSHTKCIQFFKDSLTVNLISNDESISWSHHDLFVFFEKLWPFISKHQKYFKFKRISLDYHNALTHEQLVPYLINDGKTLELAHILKGNVLGQSIDGATFTPPIIHNVSYTSVLGESNPSSIPTRLDVQILVPELHEGKWLLRVMFSASSRLPAFDKDHVISYLKKIHEAVVSGFKTTFSDNIVNQAGVGV